MGRVILTTIFISLYWFATVQKLSPRKLHPVLRTERAEKDRFATGQKNYFFGCLMNVILDVGKKIAFLVLCYSAFLNATFFTFPSLKYPSNYYYYSMLFETCCFPTFSVVFDPAT